MTPHPKPLRRKGEPVVTYPDGREVCAKTKAGKREYNERTMKMAARQRWLCPISGLSLPPAFFDHQAGRGSGGGHRDDRIEVDGYWQNAALSYKANSEKGSKRYHWQDGRYVPVTA